MVRLRIKYAGALGGAAQELPFVRNAYFIVFGAQLARKRIKGRGELQDSHGSFVDFRMSAGAPNDGLQKFAVGTDGHFEHRRAGELPAPRDVGEIHRAHALDLAAPAITVNGKSTRAGVPGHSPLL